MRLPLASLRTDGGTQPRGMIDYTIVEEYKQEMIGGAAFPPVVVFFDGSDHWLADGFHRAKATSAAGREEIEADVRQGTREDAVWFSCGANQSHGLRRTNADKRRAVETALRLRPNASDRTIAEHVGVHPETVGTVRRDIAPQLSESDSSKRVGRDGKARSLPAPKPKSPAPAKPAPDRFDSPAGRTHDADDDCERDEDGGHVEAPKPAPKPAPPAKPSGAWLNKRDRLVAEVVACGQDGAREIVRLVMQALERAA